MDAKMPVGAQRPLTSGEWAALSPGLVAALRAAGVEPLIVARAAIGARIAGLWRGSTPILAWGRSIYWPGAPQDASAPWSRRSLAALQHELHHLWEYATGDLGPLRYAVNPRNWTYGYRLGPQSDWSDFGAEQRATIAEDLWLIERGQLPDRLAGALHRRVLPWAG
jgi:hypothetical protein